MRDHKCKMRNDIKNGKGNLSNVLHVLAGWFSRTSTLTDVARKGAHPTAVCICEPLS